MNLGEILVAVAKENGWTDVGMLELAVGDPELQVLTLSDQKPDWGGWGLTFPSYVTDYLLPNLTGSCGDTASWLQRITSAKGENTPFVMGDVATVSSGVSGAGARAYIRCGCGPHCFFIEKLDDNVRLYQSFYHGHPLSTTVPAKVWPRAEFCTKLEAALRPGFDVSQLKTKDQIAQKDAQAALFYECVFYTPTEKAGVGYTIDKNPASETAIADAIKKSIHQFAEVWNKLLKSNKTLAELFKEVAAKYK